MAGDLAGQKPCKLVLETFAKEIPGLLLHIIEADIDSLKLKSILDRTNSRKDMVKKGPFR